MNCWRSSSAGSRCTIIWHLHSRNGYWNMRFGVFHVKARVLPAVPRRDLDHRGLGVPVVIDDAGDQLALVHHADGLDIEPKAASAMRDQPRHEGRHDPVIAVDVIELTRHPPACELPTPPPSHGSAPPGWSKPYGGGGRAGGGASCLRTGVGRGGVLARGAGIGTPLPKAIPEAPATHAGVGEPCLGYSHGSASAAAG